MATEVCRCLNSSTVLRFCLFAVPTGRDGREGRKGLAGPRGLSGPKGTGSNYISITYLLQVNERAIFSSPLPLAFVKKANAIPIFSGDIGPNGQAGAQGPSGPKGQKGQEGQGLSGVKYVRWGRTSCGGDAQVVYTGECDLKRIF